MKNKRYFIYPILVGLWLAVFTNVKAQETIIHETDPIVFLQKVTTKILNALKRNQKEIKESPTKVYDVVNDLAIPYVDFQEMSKWVAGRTAWGKSSLTIQQEFVSEFKELVIRTYATALNNYTNETIDFMPSKFSQGKRVQIASVIKRRNNPDIRVDYRLIRSGDSWRLYDIIIEGVSILQGFQAQFSDEIRKEGLGAVAKKISAHNQQNREKT